MKKIFKKNQLIITALAIMIAAAGYINYSDVKLQSGESKEKASKTESVSETADLDTVLSDIESLDQDITDETAKVEEETAGAGEEGQGAQEDADETASETPGEAVLTGTEAATYSAQARITREQTRAQNKETLLEIIDNESLTQEQKEDAIASMVNMTEIAEKEEAAELMLQAKGFENAVVNLTGDTADVVVGAAELTDAQRAQIEDIVKRKTGVEGQNIVITPMSGENAENPEIAEK